MQYLIYLFLALVALITIVLIERRKRNVINTVQLEKIRQSAVIVYAGFGVVGLFITSASLVHNVSQVDIMKSIAAAIIICWVVILVVYYAWAIYFYNINLGWSDDKWGRHRAKQSMGDGNAPTPNENPHGEETLGLPPGTVRGTIALTLTITALALVLASISDESVLNNNSVLADQFEFLKDAFLMMIAFYFGAKSLDLLKQKDVPATVATPAPDTSTKIEMKLDEKDQREIEKNFVVKGAEG